jgi:hypothetical protein
MGKLMHAVQLDESAGTEGQATHKVEGNGGHAYAAR